MASTCGAYMAKSHQGNKSHTNYRAAILILPYTHYAGPHNLIVFNVASPIPRTPKIATYLFPPPNNRAWHSIFRRPFVMTPRRDPRAAAPLEAKLNTGGCDNAPCKPLGVTGLVLHWAAVSARLVTYVKLMTRQKEGICYAQDAPYRIGVHVRNGHALSSPHMDCWLRWETSRHKQPAPVLSF
jgi:hypothetical protein